MGNSSLISYTRLSPNHSGKRTHAIDTITIHCMAGNLSVESCGALFASPSREASSNYGIGSDGRIALYVDEGNRSWATCSRENDQRAVTIEVANTSSSKPWPCSDKAYAALLDLVTDVCRRNGIKQLVWSTSKSNRMAHANGCNMTVHRDYYSKACPGDWLYERQAQIAAEVNKRLAPAAPALKAGTKLNLSGVRLYKSSTASEPSGTKTGTFYVWSESVVRNRIRITYSAEKAGVSNQVTGWITVEDANVAAVAATGSTPAFTPYLVRILASVLNVRKGPSTGYAITTQIRKGEVYTIVDEKNGWGKLKSGAGWIYLGYTERK